MVRHNVYFEIFGKRLLVTVEADTKEKAIEYVKSRLNIHKVEKVNSSKVYQDLADEFLRGIQDILNPKK